jgi:hypothetical protein
MERRNFLQAAAGTLLGLGLVQRLARAQAVQGSLRPFLRPWLQQLDDVSAAAGSGAVKPVEWQEEIDRLLARVDRDDLLAAIDFEALASRVQFPPAAESMTRLYFHDGEGRLQPLRFRPYLFALREGVAVVPHGHHNMLTLHLVLQGRAHVRHFDRVEDGSTHLVIRQTGDAVAEPGQVSSISDDKDNVHWFRALSPRVFMFNVGVYGVDPGKPSGERDYVDPVRGEKLADGLVRAPRLDRAQAYALYGRG